MFSFLQPFYSAQFFMHYVWFADCEMLSFSFLLLNVFFVNFLDFLRENYLITNLLSMHITVKFFGTFIISRYAQETASGKIRNKFSDILRRVKNF